jgi:DNA adenine methylase
METELNCHVSGLDYDSIMSKVKMHSKISPHKVQLLKWVGNKQRFAHDIASFFPDLSSATYIEPFLGSAAVLGTIAPKNGLGSDAFAPLMDIWKTLKSDPKTLIDWYSSRWKRYNSSKNPVNVYEDIKKSFNTEANAADFLFLTRSCYGGVIRFRKSDGYMSTPMGPHSPITPESFRKRVDVWVPRVKGSRFETLDYREAFAMAKKGDVIYCDPPYTDSQGILYGAQDFRLKDLFAEIERAKSKGAFVALSIDGTKKSSSKNIELNIPEGLFEMQGLVNVGRSMLKRFQSVGQTLEGEVVHDRILLTRNPE